MPISRSNAPIGLSLLAVATLSLFSCSAEKTGGPLPANGAETNATSQSTSAGPASSGNQGGSSAKLAEIKACDLLTSQEAAVFKAQGEGQDGDTAASGATSNCKWVGRAASGASTNLSISVRATQGIDSVQSGGRQLISGKLNGRPSTKLVDNSGSYCMFSLAVSSNSRVDLGYVVVGASDATEACNVDEEVANIVEPKLPKYEG
jgi:Protein of unknown function (DUF3558)